MIWKILGIEETKDEEAIKAAYREKLRYVNPEDDEEGFKELRRAYEDALEYANEDEASLHNTEEEEAPVKKTEVDLWLDKIDKIYTDVKDRRDEDQWNRILHDPVCDDLDTELEAGEKLLAYFMSHSYMPQSIWQLVNKRFNYADNMKQLREHFPENYLEYVVWQIENPGFIDYELFEGKTDDRVDEYINKLYEEKNVFEDGDMKAAERLLNELDSFLVKHPFTQVEWSRFYLAKDTEEARSKALEIMEEVEFECSENPYIERIYAETLVSNAQYDKAMRIYEDLLEASADNYSAALGKAKCIFLQGNPEDAKEMVEDVLEDRVQDTESLKLLDEINEQLILKYEKHLEENEDRDTTFKLGWCYYQKKEFEKGITLLDKLEPGEDYDYINLRCRLYLAGEDYEKAYPLAKKWTVLIEESVDDGSQEMQKRKNRLSLAYFSVGICLWELLYKDSDKQNDIDTEGMLGADEYIQMAIEEEHNQLVKLSYMEQLGRFFIERKRYEDCIAICNKIIEKDRGFYPAYVHRQQANYELKNAKEVIDDYYICRDIYPGYSKPYILAAEVFMVFDQYDDVEQIIEDGKAAELDSDSLELLRIKCIHYKDFSDEHVKEAMTALFALKDKINKRTEDNPTDIEDVAEVERELAILYWDQDKTNDAMKVINGYLKEHPKSIALLHLKADILNRDKKYEEAIKLCRLAVDIEPDNIFNRAKVGNCLERMENTDEAIKCYNEILNMKSDYVPAVRRLMYIYSFLSNREDDLVKCRTAIDYATRLIELTGNAEGYVERGNLYIDIYELEKSVEDCREAIRLDPDAFYAYNNLGCALLKLRRMKEAIEPLLQAIRMSPKKDYLPYLNLADCYTLLGEYDKAIETYEKILSIWPERVSVLEEIVKICRRQKNYNRAVSVCKRIPEEYLRVYQNNKKDERYKNNLIESYCDIGNIYWQAGNVKSAEAYFDKAVKLYFASAKKNLFSFSAKKMCLGPALLEDVVEYYRDTGNYDKAEKLCKRLLKLAGENNYSITHLSFTYATVAFVLGDKQAVNKYAKIFLTNFINEHGGEKKMLSEDRYRPMYLYDLAIMHVCMGNLDKAREYLSQIPDCKLCVSCMSCDCFEYYFGMGLIAELEGRKDEAKTLYKKAIEIKGYYACCEHRLALLV